ncbi:DUF5712 family protein [Spirosoma koreense]
MNNHRGQNKSAVHDHKFGQFNRVDFKERSEQAFNLQSVYRRELEVSFRYQNTMSNGTRQGKAAMTLELRDGHQEHQLQVAADRRRAEELRLQAEQAKKNRIDSNKN